MERYTRYHQTSGTGGRPLVWLDTPESWQWVVDNWREVWRKIGARPGDAALFAFSFGPVLGFWCGLEAAVQEGVRAIPAGGLEDRYLGAGGKLGRGRALDWQVAWHDYRADTGGDYGRSVFFDVGEGSVLVRSLRRGDVTL